MYIGKKSIEIREDIEHVYSVAKTYPRFVSFFLKGTRVVSEDDKKIFVEVHSCLLGCLPTKWFGEGNKKPLKAIRFTQTHGLFEGLRAHWSFIPKNRNCTKVTICTSFKKPMLTPVGESLLGFFIVEKVAVKILKELKRESERLGLSVQ